MHQQVYSCFPFIAFSLFSLLFALEWSGWSVWQAGFTLPTGISEEGVREEEEEGEGSVYKLSYFYWSWFITWNLRNYAYKKYTYNRTAVGTRLLNNGCIFAWAAQDNPSVQILCYPSSRLYCPELPEPWYGQHLDTAAAVPSFEQRLGRCHSQNAGGTSRGFKDVCSLWSG